MVRVLGRLIGFVFGSVVRHHRTDAFEALERSLPKLSPKECKRTVNAMYRGLGVGIAEVMWYSMRGLATVAKNVEVEGSENLEQALERGRGAITLTGHIGNYELIPMSAAADGHKLSVVVKTIKNQALNEVVVKLRTHDGLTFLSTRNSYRECLKTLRRNEVLGMVIDQNMSRSEGVFVDFFGKSACTSPGLAVMAAQSKAPVVPVFISRKADGGHLLKMYPAIEPPTDRSPETILAATQQYTKVLEDVIRERPEAWTWIHRRWKTRAPEDEKTR